MLILNHKGEYIKPKKVFYKFYAITCGEEGRGRKLGFIPLAKVYQTKENIATDRFTEEVEITKTQKGNWLIIPSSEKKEGLMLVTEWYGGYRGVISNNIDELVEQNKIEILATGRTAEGAAGRMGGEDQYILKILKSCKIYYTKHGRTYGNPKDWVIDIDLENRKVEHYPQEADLELDY